MYTVMSKIAVNKSLLNTQDTCVHRYHADRCVFVLHL